MYELIEALANEFGDVSSRSALHRATVRVARDRTNGDVSLVAFEAGETIKWLSSEPNEWRDVDALFSPASIPRLAAAEGKSCIIDDRSDVRSAEATDGGPGSSVVYPSMMVVPFADEGFLLAGSRTKAAFSNADLERLRVISTFVSMLHDRIDDPPVVTDGDDRVTEAAAFLSHDARNLLSVLRGRVELAGDGPGAADAESIRTTIDRLDELIEATVTLLETGERAVEPESTSLEAVTRAAWELVDDERSTLSTDDLPSVVADRARLTQLLENLFRNAVDHAGPAVTVRVGVLESERGFFVEDDGRGIDPESLGTLFEMGYSTCEEQTGLGLAIVDWIADAHGWHASVTESSEGGARFEFRGVTFPDETRS